MRSTHDAIAVPPPRLMHAHQHRPIPLTTPCGRGHRLRPRSTSAYHNIRIVVLGKLKL
jgi:hypothetical protein